ncbi:MAG: hypothetical protein ACUZ8O_14300 [Candidatus Anammoxibacter sp.]
MAREYEIRIPGLSQVFRFAPPQEMTVEAKRAVIRRAREKSPMPGFLQWIPRVINIIDDAQDILTTGLTLAKPLLRRIPGRFVPVLGWVLLANDILNISTALLSTAAGGAVPKKVVKNMMEQFGKGKYKPTASMKRFFGKTNKLSFALQAAQASETITGYGLSLGGIMGVITDSFWSIMRIAQGRKVTITTPPEFSAIDKASRFLIQTFTFYWGGGFLTKDQEMLIHCARKIATDICSESVDYGGRAGRIRKAESFLIPNIVPWNDISRRALIAEGVDPDVDQLPLLLDGNVNTTFGEAIVSVNSEHLRTQNGLKNLYGKTDEANINQLILDETGIQTTEALQTRGRQYTYEFTVDQRMVLRAVEFGIFPPDGVNVTVTKVAEWSNLLQTIITQVGAQVPPERMMRTVMTTVFGGYQEGAPSLRVATDPVSSPVRLD